MRILTGVLAVAVAVAVCTAPRAADAKAEGKVVLLIERVQDLNLTDGQETKIADIRKEYKPKVQKAAKELAAFVKEEVGKIRDVLTDEQKEMLKTMKKERKGLRLKCLAHRLANLKELDLTDAELAKMKAIRKEYRPKIEKVMKKLEGLLTDEQKQAREEAINAGKKRKDVRKALNLSDEQKEKVVAVGKELVPLVRAELQEIRDVLTKEQKAKLQEFKKERKERVRDRLAHRIQNFKKLNLTDDQKTKIREIRKEYRPKVQEAGNKLRGTIRKELEAIVAVIKG
jgi:Spy/CpxP family protein refolding chaperone